MTIIGCAIHSIFKVSRINLFIDVDIVTTLNCVDLLQHTLQIKKKNFTFLAKYLRFD